LLQLVIIAPMLQLRYFVVDKTGAVLRSDNFAGCKIVVLCQLQHSCFLILMFYAIAILAMAHHSRLRRQSTGAACIFVIVFFSPVATLLFQRFPVRFDRSSHYFILSARDATRS
jgi:hypothetical protein